MQNDFGTEGGMFDRAGIDISGIQRAVSPTSNVLDLARKAGIKVVYLKMAYRPIYRTSERLTHSIERTTYGSVLARVSQRPMERPVASSSGRLGTRKSYRSSSRTTEISWSKRRALAVSTRQTCMSDLVLSTSNI